MYSSPTMILKFLLLLEFISFVNAGCGGNLTDPTGIISSPNYPNEYNVSLRCSWTIKTSNGSQIKINVTDLNISKREEATCLDHLSLVDQGSTNPKVFCGDESVPVHISFGNEVKVGFSSDNRNHTGLRGFQLVYSTIEKTTVSPTTTSVSTTPTDHTALKTTSNSTTEPTTATLRPVEKKGLKKSAIAIIIIIVLLIVLLVVDLILYRNNMGVIYTIKTKCCGDYGSIQ